MTKRRGHNEGTIYQRADGVWVAQVSLGMVNGRRRRKSVYGKTRSEARKKMHELHQSLARGLPVRTSTPRLSEFLAEWLISVRQRVAPSTYRSYETQVRKHINPDLGHIRLEKLTQRHVNELLARKMEEALRAEKQRELKKQGLDIKDPIRMSPATVDGIRRVLRAALNVAMKWDLVGRNVAALADAPRVPAFEAVTLSRADAESFLRAVEDTRYDLLYRIALSVGLRQAEILGLRWEDVDFVDGVIRIRRQLQVVEGVQVLREPKTIRSRRTLPLTDSMMAALRRHRTVQKAERLKAGGRWNGSWDLVFMTPIGTPIDAANLRKDFRKRLDEAGLQPMRFHDLRHSAASFMAAQGVNVSSLQAVMGHAQATTTMQVYTHAQLDSMRDALEISSRVLEPKKEAK